MHGCFKLASFGGNVLSDSVAYAAIKYSLDCSKLTVLSLGSHVRSMDLHSHADYLVLYSKPHDRDDKLQFQFNSVYAIIIIIVQSGFVVIQFSSVCVSKTKKYSSGNG